MVRESEGLVLTIRKGWGNLCGFNSLVVSYLLYWFCCFGQLGIKRLGVL